MCVCVCVCVLNANVEVNGRPFRRSSKILHVR